MSFPVKPHPSAWTPEDGCQDCRSVDIIYDYQVGDHICRACGVVLACGPMIEGVDFSVSYHQGSAFQQNAEWDSYFMAQSASVLSSTTIQMSSNISNRTLTIAIKESAQALTSTDELLKAMTGVINEKAREEHGYKANLKTSTVDIFRIVLDLSENPSKVFKTRSVSAYAAVSMFIASKKEMCPRSDEELCNVFSVSKKVFSSTYTRFVCVLGSDERYRTLFAAATRIACPLDIFPRLAEELGVDSSMKAQIRKTVDTAAYKAAERKLFEDTAGNAVAAALVFIASKETIGLRELAEAVGYTSDHINKIVNKAKAMLFA